MALLESLNLPLGEAAPDFRLEATDGQFYELGDFADSKLLVVIFMCNHCPYVQAIWDRLVALQANFALEDVRLVGINPNLNPNYPEETMEKMQEYYDRYNMNFPYLQDAMQEVAKAYQAQCTPDIYVFDAERKLAYHGRLDDNWKDESAVQSEDLKLALSAILKGEEVLNQRPSMGCSIKWVD